VNNQPNTNHFNEKGAEHEPNAATTANFNSKQRPQPKYHIINNMERNTKQYNKALQPEGCVCVCDGFVLAVGVGNGGG
jgi:hypothetical protein